MESFGSRGATAVSVLLQKQENGWGHIYEAVCILTVLLTNETWGFVGKLHWNNLLLACGLQFPEDPQLLSPKNFLNRCGEDLTEANKRLFQVLVFLYYFCLFEIVRSAKNIYFDRLRVNQRRHSQLFAKKFAQTLHPARKETWRPDFNKEFGKVHFEHPTIENTALPATLLPGSVRSTPNPKTHGSTPIFIVKTHAWWHSSTCCTSVSFSFSTFLRFAASWAGVDKNIRTICAEHIVCRFVLKGYYRKRSKLIAFNDLNR